MSFAQAHPNPHPTPNPHHSDLHYVINIIGGPGVGKSITHAALFCAMKLRGLSCEMVSEYAKDLVWKGDLSTLNNQYLVSDQMYKKLMAVYPHVPYIITDGSLLHGLYYNRNNPDNVSDLEKTEQMILQRFREFNNIVILLRRGDYVYEQAGRLESENTARKIDNEMINIMQKHNIKYYTVDSNDISTILALI